MESAMQDQIDGALHLQNAICDDACNIYKQTGIMPLDMKMQRDELLEACNAFLRYDEGDQEDGVQLMIDYADALALCKSAVANAEK